MVYGVHAAYGLIAGDVIGSVYEPRRVANYDFLSFIRGQPGPTTRSWDSPSYLSWRNGSAMLVAAVGYALESLDLVLSEARRTAVPTHDHPEGIRGAQAVAGAVLLARTGRTKDEIGYDLSAPVDQLRLRMNSTLRFGSLSFSASC